MPVIVWRRVTGSASSAAYASIASLDFGTVTAGCWSYCKVVAPKVTVNSIQSCKWWLSDIGAQRSAASESVGTGAGWIHKYSLNASAPVVCSSTKASAGFGTESPESSGSGASYAAVAPAAYGNFIALALKVASAAGDGATTAWGYQLVMGQRVSNNPIEFRLIRGNLSNGNPELTLKNFLRECVEDIRRIPFIKKGKEMFQTTNSLIREVVKTIVVSKYSYT